MFLTVGQIALGGALGSVCRYLAGLAALRAFGSGFPWGTLFVNVAGGLLMGAVVVVLELLSANRLAPLLMTGFLGGFTTFSTFALDIAVLWERGEVLATLGYALGSMVLTVAALALGMVAARMALA